MTQMLNLRTRKVQNLMIGNLVDLEGDTIISHPRNQDTATPVILDRLRHAFGEVLSIARGYECVTILFNFGPITFPEDHEVQVFYEQA